MLVKQSNTGGAITLDFGLAVLGTSGTAFSLKTDTVAIVTPPCLEDEGMADLRGAREKIVIIWKGAVVTRGCVFPACAERTEIIDM